LTSLPIACGSGEAVWLAGDGWLRVSFDATQAHDDQGRSTVAYRGRVVDLPIIKEVQNTCDFGGEVTWVLGVSSPNHYRVLELKHPTRLVVDIKHELPSIRLTPP
jgi:D-alanyl-D-alanine dipeptidase